MNEILTVRSYTSGDESAVLELWKRCGLVYPQNDPRKDIQRKMKVRGDLFLVAVAERAVVASVMVGYEGHRGWINYLAVGPEVRRKGIGRRMMEEAEGRLRAEGCAKINLQVRSANAEVLEFYRAIGFLKDDVVSLGKRLERDG